MPGKSVLTAMLGLPLYLRSADVASRARWLISILAISWHSILVAILVAILCTILLAMDSAATCPGNGVSWVRSITCVHESAYMMYSECTRTCSRCNHSMGLSPDIGASRTMTESCVKLVRGEGSQKVVSQKGGLETETGLIQATATGPDSTGSVCRDLDRGVL